MLCFTSLSFGHRCCGPLSLNVVALLLSAHDVLCLPQSRDSTGEEPGCLTFPPPSSCTIYFNWHSRNVLLGLFRLKVIFLCDLFHDKEIDSLYQQKRRGKRVKGELALAFYFMVFVPQHNNPQEVTIPWRCLLIFKIKKSKE